MDGRSTCHFRPQREARSVAGLIAKLERKLEQHRTDLTHIDGVLRLFQPDRDPGEIKPKRSYARRTRYFARNELSRLSTDALRAANGSLMTTDDIAGRLIEAQCGWNDAVLQIRHGGACYIIPEIVFPQLPVHKRTFFSGVEGRRVDRLPAGARRFRVEVAAAAERIVWRAGVDRRIRLGRLSSKLPVGPGATPV